MIRRGPFGQDFEDFDRPAGPSVRYSLRGRCGYLGAAALSWSGVHNPHVRPRALLFLHPRPGALHNRGLYMSYMSGAGCVRCASVVA